MSAVPFLDVDSTAKWLARRGVEQVISDFIDALEADFAKWPDLHLMPRIATHSPDGVIELMPTADQNTYGFKYVNGHPYNPARGYQTVTAFGALGEIHNGYPSFFAEMTLLTAVRTAATSALAAKHLARADSKVMAMFGTGCQSEFQALAMRAALGINELVAWDVDPKALAKFTRNARRLGFEVRAARSGDDVLRFNTDVITVCTADKKNATILTDEMVRKCYPGIHINAIGGDCPGKTELEGRLVERASVFVEYTPQTRIEGEIQQLDPDFPVTELWQVIAGERPGRREELELTLWDSVGFAMEDWSVLRYVLRDVSTNHSDLLQQLDLIAEPTDPKNLFSLALEADNQQ